jgi:hypothetical protein
MDFSRLGFSRLGFSVFGFSVFQDWIFMAFGMPEPRLSSFAAARKR